VNIINPYSLLWVTAILLVILAVILFRRKRGLPEILAFAAILTGLLMVYFYIRPVQTPLLGADAASVRAMIGQGQPVLLEFQSPYWLACTAAKPVVDRLENEYKGKLLFIRINIQDKLGMELAPVYGFRYTPTFIFFDEQGAEVWRTIGSLDEARLRGEMGAR
jgi:thiol-disulfide isomerase/thioredoxin